MTTTEFQMQALRDPRLAVHAASAHPVWLWSADGLHVLWANPVGTKLFGAANTAVLAARTFGPADPHRRQVAQLARRLPASGATRLERLRGFGAKPGMLMTCACARLAFPDGRDGILVTALETAMRGMPLAERLRLLVEGQQMPMASFDRGGRLMGASEAAGRLLNLLSGAKTEQARADALLRGHVELPMADGSVVVQRVGSGAEVGLVALAMLHRLEEPSGSPPDLSADTVTEQIVAPAAERPLPGYEQPALTNEAPSEFALFDEFAEPLENEGEAPSAQPPSPQPPSLQPARIEAELIDNSKAPEETASAQRRHPLRFTWHMDADGYFSLGSDEIHIPDRHADSGGFRAALARDRRRLRPRSQRPHARSHREPPDLERRYPVLAGRRRRAVARRTVGCPDLRRESRVYGLSRLRRLPRPRQPGASRRAAPAGGGQRRCRAGRSSSRRRHRSANARRRDGRCAQGTISFHRRRNPGDSQVGRGRGETAKRGAVPPGR